MPLILILLEQDPRGKPDRELDQRYHRKCGQCSERGTERGTECPGAVDNLNATAVGTNMIKDIGPELLPDQEHNFSSTESRSGRHECLPERGIIS